MSCAACPSGQGSFTGTGSTGCGSPTWASSGTACPQGQYGSGAICTMCAAGQYGNQQGTTAANSCANCAIGWYTPTTGMPNCFSCPLGYYAAAGAAYCTAVSVGHSTDQLSSSVCAAGTYAAWTGMMTVGCVNCPGGQWSAGSASACTACAAGMYISIVGASSNQCATCAAGQSSYGNFVVYSTSLNQTITFALCIKVTQLRQIAKIAMLVTTARLRVLVQLLQQEVR